MITFKGRGLDPVEDSALFVAIFSLIMLSSQKSYLLIVYERYVLYIYLIFSLSSHLPSSLPSFQKLMTMIDKLHFRIL